MEVHLDNNVDTHKVYYRLQDFTTELWKVSKQLLVSDWETANIYGKPLDELRWELTYMSLSSENQNLD